MKIEYLVEKGCVIELEVDEQFGNAYEELLKNERREHWRKKKARQRAGIKSDVSLEYLFECGVDFPSYSDPLDVLINQEEENSYPPTFDILTEYQKRVMRKYSVERKSKVQIAREEGVTASAICKLINKSTQKIAKFFL